MKLYIEVATTEEEDAPLSEEELTRVEKAIAKVRSGNFKVTNDPAERDEWLAAGIGVQFYRREDESSEVAEEAAGQEG